MERSTLDYAQSMHPAETAERHVPDYGRMGKPIPAWRIVFLVLAAYLALGLLPKFLKPRPPAPAVTPTTTVATPTATR